MDMQEEYNAQHRNFPGLDWFTWQIAWAAALGATSDAVRAPNLRPGDVSGQCRSENACHYPRAAAPAGELAADVLERMGDVRQRVCDAIDTAMACGYLNLNEPPAEHWLAPWWGAGQCQRAAVNALRFLDRELTQYLEGMPADETSSKLRNAARSGLAGIDLSPLTSAAGATLARELEMLISVTSQRSLTATEVSKAREIVDSIALIAPRVRYLPEGQRRPLAQQERGRHD